MANQDQTTVQLLLKAKDEATATVNKFSTKIKELGDKTESTSSKIIKNDSVLSDLSSTYSDLKASIDKVVGSSKLIAQLQATERAVNDTTKALEESKEALAAQRTKVNESKKAHSELKEQWLESKKALDELGRATKSNAQEIAAQRDVVRRANEAQKESARILASEQSSLKSLTNTRDRASTANKRAVDSYATLSNKAKEAGIRVNDLNSETKVYNKALSQAVGQLDKTKAAINAQSKALRAQAREMDKAGKSTDKFNKSTGKTGTSLLRFGSESRSAMSVTQRLRGEVLSLAAAYIGLYGVIDRTIESFKTYALQQANTAKLTTVYGEGSAQVGKDMAYVAEEAERLGLRLGTLEKAYSNFFVSANKTGETTDNIQAMFSNIMESATVLKLSQEQVDGAMNAFVQMMSKNQIMAEELQGQLAERLPGAVSIFAESIGRGTAEVRKMMEAGQLTAEHILGFTVAMKEATKSGLPMAVQSLTAQFNRLSNTGEQLERDFAWMVEDHAKDAIERLNNVLKGEAGIKLVETFAKAFKGVVEVTTWVAENIDFLTNLLKILVALKLAQVFAGWVAPLMKVAAAMKAVATRTKLAKGNLAELAIEATSLMLGFGAIAIIENEFDKLGMTIEDVTKKIEEQEEVIKKSTSRSKANAQKKLAELKALRDEMLFQKQADEVLADGADGSSRTTGDGSEEATRRKAEFNDLMLQRNRMENLWKAERKAENTRSEAIKKHQSQVRSLLSTVQAINQRYLEETADTLDKQFALIDAKFDPMIKRLRELGRTDLIEQLERAKGYEQEQVLDQGLDEQEKVITAEKLKQTEAIKESERQIDFMLDVRKAKYDEINALREKGDNVSLARASELEEQLKSTDASVISLIDSTIEMYQSVGGVESKKAILALEQMKQLFIDVEEQIYTVGQANEDITNGIVGSLKELGLGIADVIRGADSIGGAFERAGQAFAKFASGFLIKIGEMILQALVFRLISGTALGGFISGGVNATGVTEQQSMLNAQTADFNVMHTGGVIGGIGGSIRSNVDSSIFSGAARYHTGGVMGLRPDEVPIIAQRGEEMITAKDPRHRNNGGMGGNTTVQVIDQRGAESPPVETERSTGADGNEMIKVLVRDSVKSSMDDGSMDDTMAQFGNRRQSVRR